MKTLKELVEETVNAKYGGNAAEMSRLTGFSTTTISSWRNGKVNVPLLETRRKLAKELGVSYLELLVAMGEITEAEANPPADPRSAAVRALTPVIDSFDWSDGGLIAAKQVLRSLGNALEGRVNAPDIEEE